MTTRFTGLWRHPDFLKLWAGETISVFGTLITRTALPFTAIIVLGAGAAQMGVLTAAELGPGFLVGLVGLVAGVWVDRLRRRPIMIAADLLRAALLASIPLVYALDVLRIEQLYVVAFTVGALSAFFDVAYQSYLPTLVSREELVEGNAKLTASASVSEVAAFSAGGVLVQVLTAPVAILLDAVSFLASAFFIRRIRAPEPPPAPPEERVSMWHEAREGMRVVLGDATLRALGLTHVLQSLAGGLISATILLYVNRELGFSPGVLGMIFAVGGVTSLLGSLMAERVSRSAGLGPLMIACALINGLGALFNPLASSVGLLAVFLLVSAQLTDAARTILDIHEVSLRQAITPERLLGRVSASIRVAGFGALLSGALLGGVLGDAVGVRQTLFLAAAVSLSAGLALLLSPVRALRRTPSHVLATSSAEV